MANGEKNKLFTKRNQIIERKIEENEQYDGLSTTSDRIFYKAVS